MISSKQRNVTKILALVTTTFCIVFSCEGANLGGGPSGPRIEIRPAVSPILIEAQTIANKVLTCRALGDKPEMFNTLRWAGPNDPYNWQELMKRHKVKETRNGLELEFLKPTPDDSGEYYCSGIYQSSDNYNSSVTVKVHNPIKLENCHDRQFVIEGKENQKITCRITGDSATGSFSKDGRPLESYGNRYKFDNDDGLEILGPVDKHDAGQYQIEVIAELTGDKRTHIIDVAVHTKPEIAPFVPSANSYNAPGFYGIEGEQAELKCNATGYPKPLVYWKDPKLRNLTSVGGYFVNPESGTLLISKVNRNDDNGTFECSAENNVGKVFEKFPMLVLERPAIVAFENKTVDENEEVTFECRATGYPRPLITIRRHGLNQLPYRLGDGNVTDINETEEGGGARVWVSRLKIRAHRYHYAIHYCNATNSAGSAERVGHLQVRYKPDLSLTPITQFTTLGRNITVTCHIRAFPPPTVSWYSGNQQIINAVSNFKTSSDGQTHTITMMPPSSLQGTNGPITCVASNDLGSNNITITPYYMTKPSMVNAVIVDTTPTTVKMSLTVSSDGGDRVIGYRYKVDGRTLDQFNPLPIYYPTDHRDETQIDASQTTSEYTIRNLYPYYRYRIAIQAINSVGSGDWTEVSVETRRPTRPEPPIIIKPGLVSTPQASSGIPSDYNDGYLLKWSPPELDNGDPVTKYIIRFFKVNPEQTDLPLDEGQERLIEQMNERPMHANIWPLEANQRYRIELRARNKYGDSDPASIVVFAPGDKPTIGNNDALILSWLMEPPQGLLMALPVLAVLAMIVIDLSFCYYHQMGVSHAIRNCCCPTKANSVISDGTFT